MKRSDFNALLRSAGFDPVEVEAFTALPDRWEALLIGHGRVSALWEDLAEQYREEQAG